MTSLDMANVTSFMKEWYTEKKIAELTFENNGPFYSMISKNEKKTGKYAYIPFRYSDPQGVSNVFSTAQSNASPSSFEGFELTSTKFYGVATVDGSTIAHSKSNDGAFINALTSEVDGILRSVSLKIARQLFRAKTGVIGTIGALTATTITLDPIYDIHNFEVGMILQSYDTTESASHGGSEPITAVNRNTGVITMAAVQDMDSDGSAVAAADTLYIAGTYNSFISGLEDWVPESDPGATAYYGVDRTSDLTRLGGCRYDGSSDSCEDALIEGISLACVNGGNPKWIITNPKDFRELAKQLGSKVEYPKHLKGRTANKEIASIGFSSFTVHGDKGPVDVMSDVGCQRQVAWAIDPEHVKLYSAGPCPHIVEQDGLRIMRQASSDGYEVRVAAYANVGMTFPGAHCRISLPA